MHHKSENLECVEPRLWRYKNLRFLSCYCALSCFYKRTLHSVLRHWWLISYLLAKKRKRRGRRKDATFAPQTGAVAPLPPVLRLGPTRDRRLTYMSRYSTLLPVCEYDGWCCCAHIRAQNVFCRACRVGMRPGNLVGGANNRISIREHSDVSQGATWSQLIARGNNGLLFLFYLRAVFVPIPSGSCTGLQMSRRLMDAGWHF